MTHPTTPAALLPCPFCGSKPHHGHTEKQLGQDGEELRRYRIWCPQKHAYINEFNEREAFSVWNRRPTRPTFVVTDEMADAAYSAMREVFEDEHCEPNPSDWKRGISAALKTMGKV